MAIDDRVKELAAQSVQNVVTWTRAAEDLRMVHENRALEVADLMYLYGYGAREIVEEIRRSNLVAPTRQAVAEWLTRHGPKYYAVAVKTGRRYEILWVPVTGTVQARRSLAAARERGNRVAPAAWRIGTDTQLTGKQLWDRVALDAPGLV